jgi:hypothetical protein
MLFEALKVAAGKHSFQPGQEVELPEKDAKPLVEAGALAPLSKDGKVTIPPQKADKPAGGK